MPLRRLPRRRTSPHLEHRALVRKRSLDADPPHLMISGASAFGALCKHFTFKQFTHNQQACLRIS